MPYPVVMPTTAAAAVSTILKSTRRALFRISLQRFRCFGSNAAPDRCVSQAVDASCAASHCRLRSGVAPMLMMLMAFAGPLHAEQVAIDDAAPQRLLTANPFASDTSVPADTLAAHRGGSDLGGVANLQKLGGTVAENTATNIVTGANSITAGAFANVSGIPIVIQNSGANVLIQNATIINLQMQ